MEHKELMQRLEDAAVILFNKSNPDITLHLLLKNMAQKVLDAHQIYFDVSYQDLMEVQCNVLRRLRRS